MAKMVAGPCGLSFLKTSWIATIVSSSIIVDVLLRVYCFELMLCRDGYLSPCLYRERERAGLIDYIVICGVLFCT